jgi:hypothetical protein
MADFGLIFDTGVNFALWVDPPFVSGEVELPSRLNPQSDHPHTRAVGSVGVPVQVAAIVDGVEAPADADLGGELFTAAPVEWPGVLLPSFSGLPGYSSIQAFTPRTVGHYTFIVRRAGAHGAIYAHVDVDS